MMSTISSLSLAGSARLGGNQWTTPSNSGCWPGRADRARTWLHSTKLKVAAGIAGGFMIGSVSLASAGALPGQAQDVAHAALAALGVHVPPGKDRYNGPECGDVANHGEYVDAHPDDPAAGRSPCGKPNRAVNHPKHSDTDPAGAPGNSGRHGPPPWAGQGKDKDKKQDKADKPDDRRAHEPGGADDDSADSRGGAHHHSGCGGADDDDCGGANDDDERYE